MVKKISITVADWIHDTYLVGLLNKSAYVQEMIIKGNSADWDIMKKRTDALLEAQKENANLREELNLAKRRLARFDDNKRDPEVLEAERIAAGIRAGGFYDEP